MKINLKKIFERYTFQKSPPSTVHYMFPLVALALGLLGAALTSDTGSFITLTASPQTIAAGGTVSISIDATARTPVNAVDIQIAFPTDTLKISSIDTGESVITLWTEQPHAEGDKIFLRGGVYWKGFIGKHHIATIQAKALQTGTAEIFVRNMTFLAGDGTGTAVKIDQSATEKTLVTVGDKSAPVAASINGGKLTGNLSVEVVTDIDGNGKVDLADIERFMSAWRYQSSTFDFNSDGKMTFKDFAILLSDSFWK